MNEIINEIILKMIAIKTVEYVKLVIIVLVAIFIVNAVVFLVALCKQARQREKEALNVGVNYEIKGGDE